MANGGLRGMTNVGFPKQNTSNSEFAKNYRNVNQHLDSDFNSITSLISRIFLSHTQANGPVLHHPQFVSGTPSQKIEKSDSDSVTGRCHGRPEPRNSGHRGGGKKAGRTAWKSAGDGLVQSPAVHATTYDAHHQATTGRQRPGD